MDERKPWEIPIRYDYDDPVPGSHDDPKPEPRPAQADEPPPKQPKREPRKDDEVELKDAGGRGAYLDTEPMTYRTGNHDDVLGLEDEDEL